MPEIVTDFQPFENSKKPLKTMAHCDFTPRFLPTKIREEPFFVTSGMEFDLPGLWANPGSLVRLLLFFMGFLPIRIIPACLYRKVLAQRDLLPLALFSSTTLPLVVAVTFLGTRTGHMLPENATALVGAAVLSVAIFPTLAILLRLRSDEGRRDVAATAAVCRACDLVSAQFSRFIDFISPKARRNM